MNNLLDALLRYEMTNIDHPSLLPNLKEINESAETKAKCLEMLRSELKNLQDIAPCLEENFLLRFLRVSKFDTEKAFQRIMKYYHQQDTVIDALKNTSLSLQKAHSINHFWISPYRLKNNSGLLFVLGGKVDYSKVSFAERFCLEILAVNRLLENPVNQIIGATVLFDYEGYNFHSVLAHPPSWCKLFLETFMNAYPTRIKAVHIVNTPFLFFSALKIVYPFLPKKIQDRVFLHSNDGWKSLHAAIPPEVLPEQYGGHLKFDSCINVLENVEELDDYFHEMLKYGYIKNKIKRQSFRPIRRKN